MGRYKFYGLLASLQGRSFRDADFAELYCLDNSPPSVAPSLLATALLLQAHDKVSDAETSDNPTHEVNMNNNRNPDQTLTKNEMHWDRISLFLTAMSVGIFIVAVLATGKSETSIPKAAGLILASIGMVGTAMATMVAIFGPRNIDHAENLRKKTRRVGWAFALLGLTVVGAVVAVIGQTLPG